MGGYSVYQIQQKLQQLNYLKGKIDGIYGPITAHAVKEFQSKVGIQVDGIVGPMTIDKLFGTGGKKSSGNRSTQLKQTIYCQNYEETLLNKNCIGCQQSIIKIHKQQNGVIIGQNSQKLIHDMVVKCEKQVQACKAEMQLNFGQANIDLKMNELAYIFGNMHKIKVDQLLNKLKYTKQEQKIYVKQFIIYFDKIESEVNQVIKSVFENYDTLHMIDQHNLIQHQIMLHSLPQKIKMLKSVLNENNPKQYHININNKDREVQCLKLPILNALNQQADSRSYLILNERNQSNGCNCNDNLQSENQQNLVLINDIGTSSQFHSLKISWFKICQLLGVGNCWPINYDYLQNKITQIKQMNAQLLKNQQIYQKTINYKNYELYDCQIQEQIHLQTIENLTNQLRLASQILIRLQRRSLF